ncbi:hypothetical protein ACOBR2_04520 [Telmatobacter bradus]|uniref:hypothetical protein n=1 Tax=Telmatobacter bradus TaxID=474953 RepID=UPI003B42FBB0
MQTLKASSYFLESMFLESHIEASGFIQSTNEYKTIFYLRSDLTIPVKNRFPSKNERLHNFFTLLQLPGKIWQAHSHESNSMPAHLVLDLPGGLPLLSLSMLPVFSFMHTAVRSCSLRPHSGKTALEEFQ